MRETLLSWLPQDLRGKRVITSKRMPANSYGAGVKLGLDGFLYISLYQDLASFTNRIIKVRTADLSFVTSATADWLLLTGATGTAVTTTATTRHQGRHQTRCANAVQYFRRYIQVLPLSNYQI